MNVMLTGMRAAGKSTLGPLLAAELGRTFFELDTVVAQRLNAPSAAEAIRVSGIAAFRAAEAGVLAETLSKDGLVVSLGGGTPTAPGAEQLISEARRAGRAVVIFVDVDAETVRRRIVADGAETRPPILGVDAIAEVDELLAQRRPAYLRISDLRVEPRGGDPVTVARTLAAMVRNWIAGRQ